MRNSYIFARVDDPARITEPGQLDLLAPTGVR
jgi:hypothetical protein